LEDPPLVMWAMIGAAVARLAATDFSGASGLVREALELTTNHLVVRAAELPHLVRLSVAAGDLELAERALEGTDGLRLERYRLSLLSARAALTEALQERGEALAMYEEAAVAWARWGHVLEGAHALFGAGRCLAGLGRLEEARARFGAAAAAFARLGAEPALSEVRSAMAQDALNPGPTSSDFVIDYSDTAPRREVKREMASKDKGGANKKKQAQHSLKEKRQAKRAKKSAK